MNYSTLKTNIANWLVKDNLTSEIDTFIDLAEADMNTKLKHWRMEASTDLSVSTQYTSLPSDFLAFERLSCAGSTTIRMELVSRGQMQQLRENTRDTSGQPQYYALSAGQLEVYPTPDTTYTVTMLYRQSPTALSDGNTTNWVSTYHSGIYLYGALVHSAPFLMDDPRLPVWQSLYESAILDANRQSDNAKSGGASPRMKIRI